MKIKQRLFILISFLYLLANQEVYSQTSTPEITKEKWFKTISFTIKAGGGINYVPNINKRVESYTLMGSINLYKQKYWLELERGFFDYISPKQPANYDTGSSGAAPDGFSYWGINFQRKLQLNKSFYLLLSSGLSLNRYAFNESYSPNPEYGRGSGFGISFSRPSSHIVDRQSSRSTGLNLRATLGANIYERFSLDTSLLANLNKDISFYGVQLLVGFGVFRNQSAPKKE
ncbi:MAG: hypothetical protein EAZ44_02960 [Cytophagia bacterium]|nr:MAG: hypothetical protein EAZ44_02960 [Cytophagia bacterium]TAG43637.1 MAG: hypothetical protein EAZ31_03795 [Cytophagia bacterium]